MDQVFVLLYAVVFQYQDKNILQSEEFVNMMNALTSLVVRMQICDMSMNTLDRIFAKCILILKDPLKTVDDVTNLLLSKKIEISDSFFEEKFSIFSTTDNKLSEFYLRHIEKYLQRKQSRRVDIPRNLTVEHIIPQTLDSLSDWYGSIEVPAEIETDFNMDYVQSIGNKALLYGDDNTAAGNNSYAYKLDVYKNGKRGQNDGTPVETFALISELTKDYPNSFIHSDVLSRAKKLAEYAKEIW